MTGTRRMRVGADRQGAARAAGSQSSAVSVVAVSVVAVLGVAGCDTPDFERMIDQPRYDTYDPAPAFAHGMSARRPPAGTIARDAVLGPIALTEGVVAAPSPGATGVDSVVDDGPDYVRDIPLSVDAAVIARGRNRFDIFCAACHGVTGDGDSEVAENMVLRPPPSLHEARIRAFPPGRLYRVITLGYGLMPSHRARLSVRDRWAVVAYVQVLQLSQRAAVDALPDEIRAEARSWLK